MTSCLRCTDENLPKIKSCQPDRILNQKSREVFKMKKKHTILSKNYAISGSFDKNH